MLCASTLLGGLLFIALQVVSSQTQDIRGKLCVTEDKLQLCELLQKSPKAGFIDCIPAKDRVGCLHKIANGEANIINLPSNEAYAAERAERLGSGKIEWIPLLEEKSTDDEFMYESVAVVKKDLQVKSLSDLKGKKSCHTGYRRTAGWDIPVAYLIAIGAINNLICGNELASINSFFGNSCVPGDWSKNAEWNQQLKSEFSNLCQLCSQECNSTGKEIYSGYEGALKCLTEKSADVAFTKYNVVLDFAKTNLTFENDYRLLCLNGTLNPINRLCFWGARTNPLIVAKKSMPDNEKNNLKAKLLDMLSEKPWSTSTTGTIIFNNKSVDVRDINGSITEHLEKGNFSVTMDKPLTAKCHEKYAKLCVASDLEEEKCFDWKLAIFASRLRPSIVCVRRKTAQECLEAVQKREDDFTVADLKSTYNGLVHHKLKVLMSETFQESGISHYVVAVIKNNSTLGKFADLKGAKSCHAHYTCGSSWSIPIGTLASKKIISNQGCALEKAVSKYFSASCVPGAPKSLPSLCSLCKDKTVCNGSDEYAGFKGAFRCLVQGGGDVAFVKHSTVADFTDGRSSESWAKDLKSSDFKLLCVDGVKTLNEYSTCNLGTVPGKQILISSGKHDEEVKALSLMLIQSNSTFDNTSGIFKLYSAYRNESVLFTNGTSGLITNSKTKSNKDIIGEETFKLLELADCINSSNSLTLTWGILYIFILTSFQYILTGNFHT